MAHDLGKHPGAIWHRCDFQCHTPRDRGWMGSPALPGGTPENEAARQAWAEDFIRACDAAGLHAIAITDHHDICMSGYVSEAAARLRSRLLVYSGVELTLEDDAQCLALFDPAMDKAKQLSILVMATRINPAHHDDPQTCQIFQAGTTVRSFFDAVKAEPSMWENCVLLPHFGNENAHKSLNKERLHQRFAELPAHGVYIEHPFHELDQPAKDKLYGKIPEWGKTRRAALATGDNRNHTFDRLGAHECWIKLGEHSIEAVRQALLADEARICYQAPTTPTEHILSITVKSTLTGTFPITYTFNAGFTALIGGRGSGKSAILEYLRFGLGRAEADIQPDRSRRREREAGLIDDTLLDGYVEVVIERDNVAETWHRNLANRESIAVRTSDGSEIRLTPTAARERFRARAFHQKELSTTTSDPRSAADQITAIAAAEEIDRQRSIQQSIVEAKRSVSTAVNNLAASWQASLAHQQATSRVIDLKERLVNVAAKLTEEGMLPDHVKAIENAPVYTRAETYADAVSKQITTDISRIGNIANSFLTIDIARFASVSMFEEIEAIDALLVRTRTRINALLAEAVRELDALKTAIQPNTSAFVTRYAAFNTKLKEANEHQERHKTALSENSRLAIQLQLAEADESKALSLTVQFANAEQSFATKAEELALLVRQQHETLRRAAAKVETNSTNLLNASAKRDRTPVECIAALCKLLESSRVQNAEVECTEWLATSSAGGRDQGWSSIRTAIVAIYKKKILAGSPPDGPDECLKMINDVFIPGRDLTAGQRQRIYTNLTDGSVGDVVAAVPRDFIRLMYVSGGRLVPFDKASPGQQASALLELLLKQSAGTLIIDQPEDDLDNRVIMRIVELIRTSKNSRQLIFTTHNPNVVVNGDADKVLALKSPEAALNPNVQPPKIQIDADGAIETTVVRTIITTIMEGGQPAFDLRSRKYWFDRDAV